MTSAAHAWNNDRRIHKRFPLRLSVRFGRDLASGMTSDFSSHGLLIEAEHALTVGERIRVTVDWPEKLDGIVPLQLVADNCRVVRAEPGRFAVHFYTYEFRTVAKRPTPALGVMRAAA